ncbi:AbiV family abortive infection protein [Elizabethkingia meningoseptica]
MKITRKTLEDAISKALKNAQELYEEAEILKDKKKYARAYTLFHLAIEEVGKVFIVFKYLLAGDYSEDKLKKFDTEFRQHKIKIDLSTNIDVIVSWVMDGELSSEIIENITYTKEQIENLNNLKNLSLYSFIFNGNSYNPSDMIESEDVDQINQIAEYRIKGTEDLAKVLLKDLDHFISVAASARPKK